MFNFREPTYRTEYQQRTILVIPWGDDRGFFAQINDEAGQPVGAAPKLYDSIDAAVNVCKDLIDFLYGDVECYQERPEPKAILRYSTAAGPTIPLPRIFAP